MYNCTHNINIRSSKRSDTPTTKTLTNHIRLFNKLHSTLDLLRTLSNWLTQACSIATWGNDYLSVPGRYKRWLFENAIHERAIERLQLNMILEEFCCFCVLLLLLLLFVKCYSFFSFVLLESCFPSFCLHSLGVYFTAHNTTIIDISTLIGQFTH